MRFAKLVVLLHAVAYLGFGIAFLLRPAELADFIDVSVETPAALTELRAFYGGLEIGLGLWLLAALPRGDSVVTGRLAGAALFMACVAGARACGLVIDGPTSSTLLLFAIEAVLTGLAVAALWHGSRRGFHAPPARDHEGQQPSPRPGHGA